MIIERSHYHLLRITLEAKSAHGIHTGHGDTTHDSLVVRDANGLPTLPGSSIAGVLRHQFTKQYGMDASNKLFGYINQESQSQASWLTVAWGMIHDSHNQPLEGLLAQHEKDELLKDLLDDKPIVRQRVRLNEYGTAEDTGKFDTTWIPAGARYTTWIAYWCDGSEQSTQLWESFLSVLKQPQLHIGKGTRSGTGLFELISLHQGHWDLCTPEGRKGYTERPRARKDTRGLTQVSASSYTGHVMTMQLQAESAWRIGGGEGMILNAQSTQDKEPDLLPMHESRITWSKGRGTLNSSQCYLLPATAIKGALRHRIAYHYRCLEGKFSGNDSIESTDDCLAVRELFGYANADNASAGILVIHDIMISHTKAKQMMHNKIDRFTGGVIDGALFSELVLWNTPITLTIEVFEHTNSKISIKTRKALALALEDLASGWLPLGAGGSRGLGMFYNPDEQGAKWSDQGQWINMAEGVPV